MPQTSDQRYYRAAPVNFKSTPSPFPPPRDGVPTQQLSTSDRYYRSADVTVPGVGTYGPPSPPAPAVLAPTPTLLIVGDVTHISADPKTTRASAVAALERAVARERVAVNCSDEDTRRRVSTWLDQSVRRGALGIDGRNAILVGIGPMPPAPVHSAVKVEAVSAPAPVETKAEAASAPDPTPRPDASTEDEMTLEELEAATAPETAGEDEDDDSDDV